MRADIRIPNHPKLKLVNPFNKDYVYFLACAEAGSILRASERLDLQQAGLSKRIQNMEHELGEKLFYRNARGLQLTDYGKGLYDLLRQTKLYWDKVYINKMDGASGGLTKIRIGCHPTIASNEFHKILPVLTSKFRALTIETELDTSLEITRKIAQMTVDVGIVINPVRQADLVCKMVGVERICAWHSRNPVERFLLYNPEMFQLARLVKQFRGFSLIPIRDYDVIANTVRKTNFVGLLPNPTAERHNLSKIGKDLIVLKKALTWHKDRFTSSAKHQIIEAILAAVQ